MINLECKGHDTSFELGNIIHLFEPYTDDNITLMSELNDRQASAVLLKDDTVVASNEETLNLVGDALQDKKYTKLVLKKLAYTLLSEYTGKQMPWGVLTGIRPTKIVHEYRDKGIDDSTLEQVLLQDYQISQDKVQLMMNVATEEKKILDANKPGEINIYIGIPFCPTRCVYCSFTAYSIKAKEKYVESYLDALCKEISFIAEAKKGQPVRSLYIGGGTPTSLDEVQFERLLKHIQTSFDLRNVSEYTVEAGRPDTITREKLVTMKEMGVGRISINPQTMNQKTLDTIGRHHTVEDIKAIYEVARELGHTNINMDMILGLPGEDVADVRYTLQELQHLNPENITVHTMAIKKASRLKEEKDKYQLAEVEKIEQMLALCKETAEAMQLKPYYMYRQKNMLGNFENIGYAKEGYECVYNIEIMEEKQSIIAAGAGAITKMVYQNGERIDRIPNVKSLEDYITRIDEMIERKREGFIKYQ